MAVYSVDTDISSVCLNYCQHPHTQTFIETKKNKRTTRATYNVMQLHTNHMNETLQNGVNSNFLHK